MKEVDLTPLLDKLSTMTADDFIKAGGVKTTPPLKENLKLYVEYSNEVWNGQFKQANYAFDTGLAMKLHAERYTAGLRYHAWASIRLFRAVDLVWGADNSRVVKVLAGQAVNMWAATNHIEVMNDPQLNPWGVKATAYAVAPYFNTAGNSPDLAAKLREGIREIVKSTAEMKTMADKAKLSLIAYEGGQHIIQNAHTVNRNPVMYDMYGEYLKEMSQYISHFCHYAHVGQAGGGGAWGCMEFTGQPVTEAHKYRALTEWAKANPGNK